MSDFWQKPDILDRIIRIVERMPRIEIGRPIIHPSFGSIPFAQTISMKNVRADSVCDLENVVYYQIV